MCFYNKQLQHIEIYQLFVTEVQVVKLQLANCTIKMRTYCKSIKDNFGQQI